MRKLNVILMLLCTIVLMHSCYEPGGENFTVVEKTDFSNVAIDLDESGDTIFVDQRTWFHFNVKGLKTLWSYKVYIDGIQTESRENPSEYSFGVDASTLGTGVYKLSLETVSKSGTESLADKLDVEGVIAVRTWVLVVDLSEPPPRVITIDSTGGKLTVSWDAYTKWNFKSYTLTKRCYDLHGNTTQCRTVTFDNSNATEWADEDYIGGGVSYQILLRTSARQINSELKFVRSKSAIAIELLPDKKIKFIWTRPTFSPNVLEQKIYCKGALIKTLTTFDDTVAVTENPFKFGTIYQNAFEIVSTGKNGNTSTQQVQFMIGRRMDDRARFSVFSLGSIWFDSHRNQYLATTSLGGPLNLTRYDQDFGVVVEKEYRITDLGVSENGDFIYGKCSKEEGFGIYKEMDPLFRFDPITLDTTRMYNFSKWFSNSTIGIKLEVANNNLIAYDWSKSGDRGHALAEMPSGKPMDWRRVPTYGVALSPDGKYYYDYGRLYQINGSTLTMLDDLGGDEAIRYSVFQRDAPHKLMLGKGNTLTVYDVLAKTSSSYSLGSNTAEFTMQYDRVSHWVIVGNYMINLDTNESFTIPVETTQYFKVANGKIFTSKGYVADIALIKELSK